MKKILKGLKNKAIISIAMFGLILGIGMPSIVSRAYDYYDGDMENHPTYGATKTDERPGSGATYTTGNYIIQEIAIRGTNRTNRTEIIDGVSKQVTDIPTEYVENESYANTNNWKYFSGFKGSMLTGWNTNNDSCKTWPSDWSGGPLGVRLGSDGIVYYTCTGDGNTNARFVDFKEYGYYDQNNILHLTGYSGYLYCPTCCEAGKVGNNYAYAGRTSGSGGTYRVLTKSSGQYQGMYVYPASLTNNDGGRVIATDPSFEGEGYSITIHQHLENLSNKNYTNLVSGTTGVYETSEFVDGSQNGKYVKYSDGVKFTTNANGQVALPDGGWANYPSTNFAIKITNPLSNNVVSSFGHHTYRKYYDKINFSYWWLCSHGLCIHNSAGDNNFSPLNYGGKTLGLGSNGWNYVNPYGACGHNYEKGYAGVCADCGEKVTALVYASPQTISSIRSVKNGTEYYYFCPNAINNMRLSDGTVFYYLYSQVENQFKFKHSCIAVGKNQYFLEFNTNSPEPSYFKNSSYKVGGFFYDVYTDNTNVEYVPEGGSVEFGRNVPTIKSKNTIPNPTWDSKGYIFAGWVE